MGDAVAAQNNQQTKSSPEVAPPKVAPA